MHDNSIYGKFAKDLKPAKDIWIYVVVPVHLKNSFQKKELNLLFRLIIIRLYKAKPANIYNI